MIPQVEIKPQFRAKKAAPQREAHSQISAYLNIQISSETISDAICCLLIYIESSSIALSMASSDSPDRIAVRFTRLASICLTPDHSN